MNLSNSELDQLFESVRKEKPVATYSETERAFIAGTIASVGGVLATKRLLKLLTFKQWIIMISVLSAATVGTLMVTMSAAPVKGNNETAEANLSVPAKEINKEEATKKTSEATESNILKLEKLRSITAKLEEAKSASLIQARKITTQYGKPPVTVRAYLMDDGTYHFEYVITAETTEQQPKELQEKAKEAGFELKYQPTFSDSKLQKLSLQIVQKKENGQSQDIRISEIDLEENSEYKVAWNVDDKGTATTIACGENFKSEDIDELLEGLDFEELTAEMNVLREELIVLDGDLEQELSIIKDGELFEIAEIHEGLIRAEEMLEDPEFVGSLAAAYEGLDADILEDVRESLEEAREALEENEALFKKECEEMRVACEEQAKKCKEGQKEILSELRKDGLIKENQKRVKMQVKNKKMTVNGKEVPKNLRDKYKDLVEEYFDIDTDQNRLNWTWTTVEDKD
ncbi:hypothetical protein N9355_09980 [Crocinitomicaceae bacterium]|nr:hypothetical protein [Crocinitomicaceae bacterium]